jgi:hypothetical protein
MNKSKILYLSLLATYAAACFNFYFSMGRNYFGPTSHMEKLVKLPWDPSQFSTAIIILTAVYVLILFFTTFNQYAQKTSLTTILILTAVAGTPLLLTPSLMSSDIFDYIIHGRFPLVYSANPYLTTIGEYPSDMFYNATCWKGNPAVYGPVWITVSFILASICQLFNAGFSGYVFAFKGFSLVLHLINTALIWKIFSHQENKNKVSGTLLYCLNPLTLIEFAGNGHNEALVITLILLGILYEQKNKSPSAAIFFSMAALSKIYVLPVLCLFVAYKSKQPLSWEERGKKLVMYLSLFLIVSFVFYLPFGFSTNVLFAPFSGPASVSFTKSIGEFIVYRSSINLEQINFIGGFFAENHQGAVHQLALFFIGLICLWGAIYVTTIDRLIIAMTWYLFFWCSLGSTWFMPWYVTILVAVCAVSTSKTGKWVGILFSLSVFLIYFVESATTPGNKSIRGYIAQNYALILFGIPLAFFMISAIFDFCFYFRRITNILNQIRNKKEV